MGTGSTVTAGGRFSSKVLATARAVHLNSHRDCLLFCLVITVKTGNIANASVMKRFHGELL
jgi:hypothetical protein